MSDLFQITCLVKDKRLASVLRALEGKAYNVQAVPAHIGSRPNGKATAETKDRPNARSILGSALLKTEFNLSQLKAAMGKAGFTNPKRAAYNALYSWKKRGLVKEVKKGTYRVAE